MEQSVIDFKSNPTVKLTIIENKYIILVEMLIMMYNEYSTHSEIFYYRLGKPTYSIKTVMVCSNVMVNTFPVYVHELCLLSRDSCLSI